MRRQQKGMFILNLTEKTLEENIVFEGHIITVSKDRIELPNGHESEREVVRHSGGVGIIALCDNGDVLLVNQFRYPYKSELLEIPAGKLNPGEDPLECGKRELQEETGAQATQYESLGKLLPSPGYTNEIIYLYLAKGLTFGKQQPDEDEFLDVVTMPLKEAVEMVMSGKLTDSKTQIALLKTWNIIGGR
jgi:ADP-ribose pyrophosphatase